MGDRLIFSLPYKVNNTIFSEISLKKRKSIALPFGEHQNAAGVRGYLKLGSWGTEGLSVFSTELPHELGVHLITKNMSSASPKPADAAISTSPNIEFMFSVTCRITNALVLVRYFISPNPHKQICFTQQLNEKHSVESANAGE